MVPTAHATTAHQRPSKPHEVGGQTADFIVQAHRALALTRHRTIKYTEAEIHGYCYCTNGEGTA